MLILTPNALSKSINLPPRKENFQVLKWYSLLSELQLGMTSSKKTQGYNFPLVQLKELQQRKLQHTYPPF